MPSVTPEELDRLYAGNPDPWDFKASAYERLKYRRTLALLPRRGYKRVLEVGCSIGVLGRQLALRSKRYLGLDASPRAVALARASARPGMEFRQCVVPQQFPPGPFDLVVLSEVLYFLGVSDVRRLAVRVRAACPRGDVVCVNFLGPIDHELDGAQAVRAFARALGRPLVPVFGNRRYRIDIARSPA